MRVNEYQPSLCVLIHVLTYIHVSEHNQPSDSSLCVHPCIYPLAQEKPPKHIYMHRIESKLKVSFLAFTVYCLCFDMD